MFCHCNFNWHGRVGLVNVELGVELVIVIVRVRVRNNVKDIGSGLGSRFALVSGLLVHLAKITQIFHNFNSENKIFLHVRCGDLTLSIFCHC